MSKSQVALVVIVVVLVIAFAAGLLSGNDSESSSVDSSRLVNTVRRWLITEAPAEPSDFRCECLSGSFFSVAVAPAGEWPAQATVVSSKTQIRKAPFRLTRGAKAEVRYEPAGKDAVPVQVSIESGEAQDLSLLKDGGVLKFRCVTPIPQDIVCLLRLE